MNWIRAYFCSIEEIYQFEIKAKHIVGEENRLEDYLSSIWHIHNRYQNRFVSRVEFQNYEEIQVPDSCYHFLNNWSFIFIELDVLNLQSKISAKHAYAESTNKNIRTQLEAYFMFCIYFEFVPISTSVQILTLYAQFLSRSFKSVDSIRNYISAMKLLHLYLDLFILNWY
jgi:hypothetical protein